LRDPKELARRDLARSELMVADQLRRRQVDAAITRLPSSDGAATPRGPLGRFDTDVSFDAKVTGGITLFRAGEDDHGDRAAAVGAALSRRAPKMRPPR
jgi:hypothetical protein